MSGTYEWQPSFAGGVIGPSLHGRVDLAKYAVGLKEGHNIFIHAHGGFSNRAGTELVGELGESGRLIPFERDEATGYVLALLDQKMKVYRKGDPVMSGSIEYEFALPYSADEVFQISYVQSVDVMYLAHRLHAPQKLMHLAADDWALAPVMTEPNVPVPTIASVTSNVVGTVTYRYRVSAVIDGVEGYASDYVWVNSRDLSVDGTRITVTWSPLSPAPDYYRVYRQRGGVFGYIGFTDGASNSIADDNINALTDNTVREPQTFFDGPGNYPSVVALTQQRLLFGATDSKPDLIVGSVVGDYENFSKAMITKPDDRFKVEISGEKLNRITAMVGMQELVVFTGSGEYGVGTNDGYLDATQPRQVRYGASGSIGIRPLMVGESVLYVDRSGEMIRDLLYSLERDGYSGSDLSLFIPNFLRGNKVVDWAFTQAPYGLVWVALNNGRVICLTYKREQEVWAWTEHDFGGKVESLCSIWEDGEDRLYLAVRRSIGGEDKIFIERMASRQIVESADDGLFLDCSVRYEGDPTKTFGGLDHLEGEEVSALGDGDVYHGLVVEGGEVTLPRACSRVSIGLRYKSYAETLPLYMNVQNVGAIRGLLAKATQTYVQVEKTRGISVMAGGVRIPSDMIQHKGDLSAELELYTGLWRFDLEAGWDDKATIRIEQSEPLPMTILGISPKWSLGLG